MRLAGKRAVVTGSTKGIGFGIARAFVCEGARVVINARSADDCAATAKELGASAVVMLTKVMAIEWAASGVRVHCIAPGYVETEIVKGLTDEIESAAVFLAGDEASFVTGEVLTVDGGWSAYGYL